MTILYPNFYCNKPNIKHEINGYSEIITIISEKNCVLNLRIEKLSLINLKILIAHSNLKKFISHSLSATNCRLYEGQLIFFYLYNQFLSSLIV